MGPKLLIAFVVILQLAGNVVVCYNDEQDLPWHHYVFEFGNPDEGTITFTKEGEIQGGKLTIDLPYGQLGVDVTYVRVEVTAPRRPVVLYDRDYKRVSIEVDDFGLYQILAKTQRE